MASPSLVRAIWRRLASFASGSRSVTVLDQTKKVGLHVGRLRRSDRLEHGQRLLPMRLGPAGVTGGEGYRPESVPGHRLLVAAPAVECRLDRRGIRLCGG